MIRSAREPGVNISIVNGSDAEECEFPWQVSFEDSYGHFCGGSLITSEWVLSAAHCIDPSDTKYVKVRVGHYRRERGGTTHKISLILIHPKYTGFAKKTNDLALAKLESPVQMGSCVNTVRLPQRDVEAGTSCWTTGWGTIKSTEQDVYSDKLQKVQMDVVSLSVCKDRYERLNDPKKVVDSTMLCAIGRGDACQGDSGGPFTCRTGGAWTIYGATSWGEGCNFQDYPGVWANVYRELDWIEETIGGSSISAPA